MRKMSASSSRTPSEPSGIEYGMIRQDVFGCEKAIGSVFITPHLLEHGRNLYVELDGVGLRIERLGDGVRIHRGVDIKYG